MVGLIILVIVCAFTLLTGSNSGPGDAILMRRLLAWYLDARPLIVYSVVLRLVPRESGPWYLPATVDRKFPNGMPLFAALEAVVGIVRCPGVQRRYQAPAGAGGHFRGCIPGVGARGVPHGPRRRQGVGSRRGFIKSLSPTAAPFP